MIQIRINHRGRIMQGTTFILRVESAYGFWTVRVCGQQLDKFYVSFGNIACC